MHWSEWVVLFMHLIVAPAAAGHALISKRDPRTAFGWIAVCLMLPLAGPFLYFIFGINRVRTRARKLANQTVFNFGIGFERTEDLISDLESISDVPPEHRCFTRISNQVDQRPLTFGNQLNILHNGEKAYPEMVDAINKSQNHIYMSTYIFDTDDIGRMFVSALAAAVRRGVDVKVIIDGVGEKNSLHWASTLLRKAGVRACQFLPPRLFPPQLHVNLRTHRKILVADGVLGFTGGMNISARHLVSNSHRRSCITDVHFRMQGPIVSQLEQVFLESWEFLTGESVELDAQEPPTYSKTAICRAITSGPDEDIDKLALILSGAISAARKSVLIMTPYFLPSREMISAMQSAVLRGVDVVVVLPEKNNLPFVKWATQNLLWELLQYKIQVYYQPPPFAHTKLFVVDDSYAQIGSANLDPRSLRLNFELVVEVMDRVFAYKIADHIRKTAKLSRQILLKEVDGRSLAIRLRDSISWLFSPYL